ncbi:MAG: hypothetical protein CVU84_06960 [Firmicutes bacterium HGW-Firmicutes-1]|jgi:hypothetical protein|nr:MAG: hypothetical protein CVU84_06960 [Firmicutes bacterium HGW-Firmicutes-1]
MKRVFESHIHFPIDMYEAEFTEKIDDETTRLTENLVDNLVKAKVVKASLLGGRGKVNEMVKEAIQRYPELFIGLAYIDIDKDNPEILNYYKDSGFKGIKIICPNNEYDEEKYDPFYELAEKLNMVALFHTGVIGNAVDYLVESPFDKRLIETSREFESKIKRFNSSSRFMLPIYLDNIALKFPELKIIGAHLGYGMYDVACAIARFRRNVFFDLSGGDVIRRHITEKKLIGKEISSYKLLYASDGLPENVYKDVKIWEEELYRYGLSDKEMDNIMYLNAARIYGVEELEG